MPDSQGNEIRLGEFIFMKVELLKMWERYSKRRTISNRNKLIDNYVKLAKRIGGVYHSKKKPPGITVEEIHSYALLGLIDAVEKFDYKRGIKFITYAGRRIKGAIIDCLRQDDWVPRQVRQRKEETVQVFSFHHADPDGDEYKTLDDNPWLVDPEALPPEHGIEVSEEWERLTRGLNGKERLVIAWRYVHDRSFIDVAARLGLSDSRVFQIHSDALAHIARRHEMIKIQDAA